MRPAMRPGFLLNRFFWIGVDYEIRLEEWSTAAAEGKKWGTTDAEGANIIDEKLTSSLTASPLTAAGIYSVCADVMAYRNR